MLDAVSLRVLFTVVALTLLTLFYFVAYRSTRSPYAGWWCVALGLFLVGSAAYLLDGTSQQWWANPLGNTTVVAGAAAVWAGARAVHGQRLHLAVVGTALVGMVVASALDDPGTNVWSGGPVFLSLMTLFIGSASVELWTAALRQVEAPQRRLYAPILRSMAVMSGVLAAFYAVRTVAFLAAGQESEVFAVYLGTEVTTIVTTVMLATVSFSMTALSHADETLDLRERATQDGLTGLLNRAEFDRLAAPRWRAGRRGGADGTIVLADLDRFKCINDRLGHPAGDYALQTFAAACRGAVTSGDLVARYGGEEFVLFLAQASAERAREVVEDINTRLHSTPTPEGMELPTVSYGIAVAGRGDRLEDTVERADAALYEAKTQGRDRAVVAGGAVD